MFLLRKKSCYYLVTTFMLENYFRYKLKRSHKQQNKVVPTQANHLYTMEPTI